MTEPISYTPRDAAAAIGVSEATIREAYKYPGADRLEAVRVGSRILISRAALLEWLRKQPRV